jgi:PadR family transcriptional regulator, regulatory protein AphA
VEQVKLSEAAYVVLGLLAGFGPGTPYELKLWADRSIGHFWSFPRAQLYVEPARLAEIGLVEGSRERGGRHRLTYKITPQGKARLRTWLRQRASRATEIRDEGLLKLYLSAGSSRAEIATLAREQAEVHRERLAQYEGLLPEVEPHPRALVTLRFGILFESNAVKFWDQVAAHPPAD